MEHAVVSVATGVMSPLLGKLSTLLEKEYSKLKCVRDDILFLKDELSSIHAFLVKLEDVDDLDIQVKEWRNQVRELSYDVEDCIDDFMLRVDHGSQKGFFQKIIPKLKTLGARHDIAEQIRKLKDRADQVSDRRKRYNFDGTVSNSSGVVPIDPRLTALYADINSLVGMDGPKDEIIKLLTKGEVESVLRVVSICGFGGLGKTTLANQVYHQLKGQFECQAFVSVSQKPDLVRLLSKILSQVKAKVKEKQSVSTNDVKDLIDGIRKCMLHKRYFIIIDDLWDTSAWSIVRCAFPENNHGSRVIITTRIERVARACSAYEYTYMMRPLNNQDSRRLFFNRIFGSRDACPPQFKEVSAEILKKCNGLPLAIITVSSILASEATKLNEWKYIQNSLSTMYGTNSTFERMRQILNLSYMNLPHYLKACFLYIGIYPEDYQIRKDDLVRQWVAEGFVSKVHGKDAEDVARSYFNELVNRSMIQIEHRNNIDGKLHCTVHDMMLELIIYKSREENFITVIDDPQDITGLDDKVRRLSLHLDSKHGTIPATIDLSHVRSLAVFGKCNNIFKLPLLKFRLLRVLILDCLGASERAFDLTRVCSLFLLRYFKASSRVSLQLPTQIRGLQYLETFDVKSKFDIPLDIVHLPHLMHMRLATIEKLPDWIGSMNNLRSLRISFSELWSPVTDHVDLFCSSFQKIIGCNLKYFSLAGGELWCLDSLSCSHPTSCHLQELYLSCGWFSKIPKWIGELHNLEVLELNIGNLSKDGVCLLAQLPALINLLLYLTRAPKERVVICGTAFPVLERFVIRGANVCLAFEAGAMPRLQRLRVYFNARGVGRYGPQLVGFEHLSDLKEFSAYICGAHAEESEIRAAKSALRDAVGMHPSHPTINIICHPRVRIYDADEDKDGYQ